eukprot:TRINITY_DN1604_c0_g1_i1.p1 TRINITY_DN1604_c0_g1~~TRINITY_DN1604_c0_g1_i1.p1  ORF type:complete len:313 (+),score=43.44 TRINITY_DN1604_c0_g1_i1:139-1077(+)
MRLNSREVQYYARYSGAADRSGYLQKRGAFNTQFKRRWFELKGNLLFYFRNEDDSDPLGVIIMTDCRPETCDASPDPNLFVFRLKFDFGISGTREYELAAETEKDMMAWMKAIADANYDMLKIAVADLRARVERARRAAEERKSVSSRRLTYSNRHDRSSSDASQGDTKNDPMAARAAVVRAKTSPKLRVVTTHPDATEYQPAAGIQQQASAALLALEQTDTPEAPPRAPPRAPARHVSPKVGAKSMRSLPRHVSSPTLRNPNGRKLSEHDPRPVSAMMQVPAMGRRARSTSASAKSSSLVKPLTSAATTEA